MAKAWKQDLDLMARLGARRNHPANINQDIMTWAAMCDTQEELEAHVLHSEDRAARYEAPPAEGSLTMSHTNARSRPSSAAPS